MPITTPSPVSAPWRDAADIGSRQYVVLPMGLMFTPFAALLVVCGPVTDKSIHKRSLVMMSTSAWGALLLVFGVVMLLLGRRGTAMIQPADTGLEGRSITKELSDRHSKGGH